MRLLSFFAFVASVLYAIFFAGADPEQIIYTCLQLMITFILLFAMSKWIFSLDIVLASSPLFLLIYTSVGYFYIDSYSYLVDWQADIDFIYRLAGATVIAIVILGGIALLRYYYNSMGSLSHINLRSLITPATMYVTIVLEIAGLIFLRLSGITALNYDEVGDSVEILSQSGWGLLLPAAVIAALVSVNSFLGGLFMTRPRRRRGDILPATVAIISALASFWISTFMFRSRLLLFTSLIVFLVGFQASHNKLGKRLVEPSIWLLPFLIMISGDSFLSLMGRDLGGEYTGLNRYISRVGFTHFATFMASSDLDWSIRFQVLWDGILTAVPQILLPGKSELIKGAYDSFTEAAGLSPVIDYPDTLYSSGAMIAGWPGLIIMPVAYFLLVGWLGEVAIRLLARADVKGLALYFGILILCSYSELSPTNIWPWLRHFLMISMIFLLILSPVYRNRSRRSVIDPHVDPIVKPSVYDMRKPLGGILGD